MIARLRGELVELDEGRAVLEVGGVGYDVRVGSAHGGQLTLGQELTVWVSTQVREDAITLFGFRDRAERKAFEQLLGVSGIGPKLAAGAVDSLGLARLAKAIQEQDSRTLCGIPGVGKKTAQRMLLELRDKLSVPFDPTQPAAQAPKQGSSSDPLSLALARLGYRKSEIDAAYNGLRRAGLQEAGLQERLSGALKVLSGQEP